MMAGKILFALFAFFFVVQLSTAMKFILILPNGEEVSGPVEQLFDITVQHYPELYDDQELKEYAKKGIEKVFEDLKDVKFDTENLDTSAGVEKFKEDVEVVVTRFLLFLQDVYDRAGMELSFSDE